MTKLVIGSIILNTTDMFIPVSNEKVVCPNPNYRGRPCARTLFVGGIPRDAIEIKCPRCKQKVRLKRL